jgi:multicomponent Na+:H+ antiporter subunit F
LTDTPSDLAIFLYSDDNAVGFFHRTEKPRWIKVAGSNSMMTEFLLGVAAFLLLNIFVGVFRLARGPTAADRMLVVQLFGTTGVAILLLLSAALSQPALVNVALVFALLAVMTIVAFAKRAAHISQEST